VNTFDFGRAVNKGGKFHWPKENGRF